MRTKRLKEEHDSCGIVACIQKNGVPSHDNVKAITDALVLMSHRAGFVNNEGDGCGILMDIPRKLWTKKLFRSGVSGGMVDHPGFIIGHFFLFHEERNMADNWIAQLRDKCIGSGFDILIELLGDVRSDELGPLGLVDEPLFIQLALYRECTDDSKLGSELYDLQCEIEKSLPIHVVSLSPHTVIYKVRGSATILLKYFPDLQNKECLSAISIGHNRYSTNTSTVFERVQPFSLLGHNGEINTIKKLREEAEMLGFDLVEQGSDSQDLNRTLEGFIHRYGCSLFEAMEMMFPPILHEIKQFSGELQDLYMFYRSVWGPFAQGPAGIVSRYADTCVFSVDALGLRPLWSLETEESFYFSSEQGILSVTEMVAHPKPLAPGEKIGIIVDRNARKSDVFAYHKLQQYVLENAKKKHSYKNFSRSITFGAPVSEWEETFPVTAISHSATQEEKGRLLAAFGWDSEHLQVIDYQATTGMEPIRSLGYDGPLAVLSNERQNLSDYYKESVAVVTNPAIDREREIEHFSNRVVLGPRPSLILAGQKNERRIQLQSPLLFGGHRKATPLGLDLYRPMAHEVGTYLFEDLLRAFHHHPNSVYVLDATFLSGETVPEAIERLQVESVKAVADGANLLVIDDRYVFCDGHQYLDPHLVTSTIHLHLKNYHVPLNSENLRRRCSIVLRSGAIRNLHDIALSVGFGADAVNPYMMWEVASQVEPQTAIKNLYVALQKGLEKVISTLGIHELRGYARLFASIGFRPEVDIHFQTSNFFGSDQAGVGWDEIEKDSLERAKIATANEVASIAKSYHYYPRIWKVAGDVSQGLKPFSDFAAKVTEMESTNPISIRHLVDVKVGKLGVPLDPNLVDISIGQHDLPFLISSMSFGSQNEIAYRAYAEAAYQLNMLSMNGEGGEIKDMIGKYPNHRGMQIASGRFGVNMELINSTNLLEIKIGQGAKPGEGGHLPGSKVSVKVAAARHAQPGTDLISPSNNHDIYSIEELAQMIDELKIANPKARVSVKVPIVPGIGTIAVGIAKAGADIITLSGFDGGTGAARAHALKYVGFPVELGVKFAHRELVESGLRDKVELWADGGMKTGLDALKLILLGANRLGFGTMAMVAVGCTGCRGCHKDTCHVGIATQIDSLQEAKEKGLKLFKPREFESAVQNLITLFHCIGEHLREWTARLGAEHTQDLVGRSDLMEHVRETHRLDLTEMLIPVAAQIENQTIPELRVSSVGSGSLTEQLAMEAVLEVAAGSDSLQRQFQQVGAHDRVLGSYLSGSVTRERFTGNLPSLQKAKVSFHDGSVVGNGFAAYNVTGVHLRVHGGAQDGVGKGSLGGKVIVLKARNKLGKFIDGSVGKGLAYGAQRGLFIVQGDADSRAGIRLSGADMIIGGQLQQPIDDSLGMFASRANIKGFAFEYMTNGRALVLGDPGPWICSGMTGGVVYVRLQQNMGLDEKALRRRIAKGAKVSLRVLDPQGKRDIQELLNHYITELKKSGQHEEASSVESMLAHPEDHFLMVKPGLLQTDQDIATE